MKRLTTKGKNYFDLYDEEVDDLLLNEIYSKLQKLEDIEEKLGCSIEVLFKAIKEFYGYDTNRANPNFNKYTDDDFENDKYARLEIVVNLNRKELIVIDYLDIQDIDIIRFKFEDYKKTWWLKEDKSE